MILNNNINFEPNENALNSLEKNKLFSQYLEIIGHRSLLLKSLQQLKNNTLCDIKRKIIDKFIDDHQFHLDTAYSEEHFYDYKLCIAYAKKSYQKVLKEQECIDLFIKNLSSD